MERVEPPRLRCTVVIADGPSRRVGPSGLIIGRQRDCDIVATDPSVSRRHALIRITGDGVEVVPLGKAPVAVNGVDMTDEAMLAHGDELRIQGLVLRVEIDLPPVDRAPARFVLERAGNSFGISHSPFVVGGGDDDDLIVKKWRPAAFKLHVAQNELYVELDGDMQPLAIGDSFTYEGETFTIGHADARVATTAVGAMTDLPSHVTIEILPRGGRIVFKVGSREHAVYLPDRRFDLMVALLRPPAEYKAGELIPDDTVRSIVWPRRPEVSRNEINMLISRCRRDLVDAGLAGPRLIERAQGGGATRVLLSAGATVEVLS